MKSVFFLIVIISFITLVSVLGIGVAIGGGDETNTANYLSAISAFAACVSSMAAVATLIFLNYVRNDWLKPKKYEAIKEFEYSLMEWEQTIQDINLYLFGFRNHSDIYESIRYVEILILKEKEQWLSINSALNKYIIYFPESEVKRNSLQSINNLRCKVLVSAPKYIEYLNELKCYPLVSKPFSDITISEEIKEARYKIMRLL